MSEGLVEVAPGYKFAVIAVPEARGHLTVPLRSVGVGLAVSSGLPAGALDSWRDNLGSFRIDELAKARVFLWAVHPPRPQRCSIKRIGTCLPGPTISFSACSSPFHTSAVEG